MKTLTALVMATFVLGFIFSADLLAGEKEIIEKLKKDGWVKLSVEELRALKDVTFSNDMGQAEYINPSGTKFVERYLSGGIYKGSRIILADGKYCYQSKLSTTCKFIWKRGKDYFIYRSNANPFTGKTIAVAEGQFTIKPGNTENLKMD